MKFVDYKGGGETFWSGCYWTYHVLDVFWGCSHPIEVCEVCRLQGRRRNFLVRMLLDLPCIRCFLGLLGREKRQDIFLMR